MMEVRVAISSDARIAAPVRGFTLLEVMTVMVVLAILFVLAIPSFSYLRAKAERAKCVNNLHNLYAAGTAYLTDHGSWPQIKSDDLEDPAYPQNWIAAFTPYKISRAGWICDTIQRALGNPPYWESGQARIDYIGTPFDDTPNAPMQWPNHPWFIERGDVHGNGNLILFSNGSVRTLNEAKKDAQVLPPSSF